MNFSLLLIHQKLEPSFPDAISYFHDTHTLSLSFSLPSYKCTYLQTHTTRYRYEKLHYHRVTKRIAKENVHVSNSNHRNWLDTICTNYHFSFKCIHHVMWLYQYHKNVYIMNKSKGINVNQNRYFVWFQMNDIKDLRKKKSRDLWIRRIWQVSKYFLM